MPEKAIDVEQRKRSLAQQVFSYLKALDSHRNPAKRQLAEQPWSFRIDDLPRHPSVQLAYQLEDSLDAAEGSATVDGTAILRVARPTLTEPPVPPQELEPWIAGRWRDPVASVHLLPSRRLMEAGEPVEEPLEAIPGRSAALRTWLSTWESWAERERPARLAMNVFERLYELHGRMVREGDDLELFFGDGLLNWRLPSGGIHHPLMLQSCELHFDPSVPEFRVLEGDSPVELYSNPLWGAEEVDGAVLSQLRRELADQGVSPLQGHAASAFLKSLVTRLSPRGQFITEVPADEHDFPRICRQPVLFLRSRSLGFAAALDAVLEDLAAGAEVPDPIAGVIGMGGQPLSSDDATQGSLDSLAESAEILLSTPANPEQIRVVQRLERHDSVVVQGPPGTGKTYTIANLIGHLLAQGKSVLVTSHTSKALTVLRDKVAPPLRSLCVSVLGNDIESRKQLESSVQTMLSRIDLASISLLDRKAEQLLHNRRELLGRLADLRRQLVDARSSEYRPVVFGGQSWSPADAARQVATDEGEHGWIPGLLVPDAILPLSSEEVSELYWTNGMVQARDEPELHSALPAIDALPLPDAIADLASTREVLTRRELPVGTEFWSRSVEASDLVALAETQQHIQQVAQELATIQPPGRPGRAWFSSS